MDLSQAVYAMKLGATVRDDGGTMKAGWSVKFVPEDTPENLRKARQEREGWFRYINPKGDDAHQLIFRDLHRASVAWRIVTMPPDPTE